MHLKAAILSGGITQSVHRPRICLGKNVGDTPLVAHQIDLRTFAGMTLHGQAHYHSSSHYKTQIHAVFPP